MADVRTATKHKPDPDEYWIGYDTAIEIVACVLERNGLKPQANDIVRPMKRGDK